METEGKEDWVNGDGSTPLCSRLRSGNCLLPIQGAAARRGPRFRLSLIEILLCLLHFVWAGGNLAEQADHLGTVPLNAI